jgi:hypothetical protein
MHIAASCQHISANVVVARLTNTANAIGSTTMTILVAALIL